MSGDIRSSDSEDFSDSSESANIPNGIGGPTKEISSMNQSH